MGSLCPKRGNLKLTVFISGLNSELEAVRVVFVGCVRNDEFIADHNIGHPFSAGTVFIRQNLTVPLLYSPLAERIEKFTMPVDQ